MWLQKTVHAHYAKITTTFWKLIISYNDRKVISNYDNATKKKSIPTVMFYKAYNSKSSNNKHLLIKWSNFNLRLIIW